MAAIAFEPSARIVRALALADLLDAAGILSADAASMNAAEWGMLARAAGSPRVPSERTRETVRTLLERREAARRAVGTSFSGGNAQ